MNCIVIYKFNTCTVVLSPLPVLPLNFYHKIFERKREPYPRSTIQILDALKFNKVYTFVFFLKLQYVFNWYFFEKNPPVFVPISVFIYIVFVVFFTCDNTICWEVADAGGQGRNDPPPLPAPTKIGQEKTTTKGGHADFIFLAPPLPLSSFRIWNCFVSNKFWKFPLYNF